MDEKPIQSLKQKKDSSLVRTIELVKAGSCSAAVSCGNTGSLMACGTIKLRPMVGVERPALGTVCPSVERPFILLDAGANPASKPEHLVHYAILGSHYCREVLGRTSPRVGLLSIGTEESKGNELVTLTNEYLKKLADIIHYIGPIEGFQVFDDQADVIVCDGFTGNILLKTCESLFHALKRIVKNEFTRNPYRMLGAFLSRGAFEDVKNHLNPDRFGGALLLGLRGNVLKAHGSSNRHAVMNAIRIASEIVAHDMNTLAREDIARANDLISPDASRQSRTRSDANRIREMR
jgi:glycerol-3-phosphate acyltransferase PlsX